MLFSSIQGLDMIGIFRSTALKLSPTDAIISFQAERTGTSPCIWRAAAAKSDGAFNYWRYGIHDIRLPVLVMGGYIFILFTKTLYKYISEAKSILSNFLSAA